MFIDLREGVIDVREKHWSVASHMPPNWGSDLKPRYIPWPEIEPTTLLVYGTTLQPTEQPSQGIILILIFIGLLYVTDV